MKNIVKLALGIVTGGALVYLVKKMKQQKDSQMFTASDGNKYKQDQTYRTADGEIFRNGKKIHIKTPVDSENHQNHVDPAFNNQHLNEKVNLPNPNIAYHQRGDRHR